MTPTCISGDDESEFKLKRDSGKHSEKTAKKHRHLMKKHADAPKDALKEEKIDDEPEIVVVGSVQKEEPTEQPERRAREESPPRPRFRKPEKVGRYSLTKLKHCV